jgi:hypothetical protein
LATTTTTTRSAVVAIFPDEVNFKMLKKAKTLNKAMMKFTPSTPNLVANKEALALLNKLIETLKNGQ